MPPLCTPFWKQSHCSVSSLLSCHLKDTNGLSTQCTINSGALTHTLIYPSLPVVARHIIYTTIQSCCPGMEGLIFPSGVLSQPQFCSCIPPEWVTTVRATVKGLCISVDIHLLFSVMHLSDSWNKRIPVNTQNSHWLIVFVCAQTGIEKEKHTHKGEQLR